MNASTQTDEIPDDAGHWSETNPHHSPSWSSWEAQPPQQQQWCQDDWNNSYWYSYDQSTAAWNDWQEEQQHNPTQHSHSQWEPDTTWADWKDWKDWNSWQDW
jgi:hypothetical protein